MTKAAIRFGAADTAVVFSPLPSTRESCCDMCLLSQLLRGVGFVAPAILLFIFSLVFGCSDYELGRNPFHENGTLDDCGRTFWNDNQTLVIQWHSCEFLLF